MLENLQNLSFTAIFLIFFTSAASIFATLIIIASMIDKGKLYTKEKMQETIKHYEGEVKRLKRRLIQEGRG